MTTQTRTFSALGTYVHLASQGCADRTAEIAHDLLDRVDAACSRFRPDSDLSVANANAGRWTTVDPLLLDAVEVAVAAAEATDGVVDPCLGRHLVELGYDRDFALVRARARTRPAPTATPDAWQELQIDRSACALLVPTGVQLDLGATAKAWASDLVAESAFRETGESVLVSLGGDIRICGPDHAEGWPVLVTEGPDAGSECIEPELVVLDGGGLATSSTRVRRWYAGTVEHHHLIDPRTGSPARGRWRTVSATGPTCVAANVASTAALVLQHEALAWLDEHAVDARLVADDGAVAFCGRWPR